MGRLRILNYHNVAIPPLDAKLKKLYVTPDQFERQCRLLKRLGLRGVTLSEGLDALHRGTSGRCVALTFDDGYADNSVHAAPILKQFGFHATCFVVSGFVGSYNTWDAHVVGVKKPLMDREQLLAWAADGNEIGSHTITHPRLGALSVRETEQEIVASRAHLERLTGAEVNHFCYPYGEYGPEALRIVQAAGYRSAVTTQRGIANDDNDAFRLPRISINGDKGLIRFALKAATPYADFGGSRAA